MEIYNLWIPKELINIIEFYHTNIKYNKVLKDIIDPKKNKWIHHKKDFCFPYCDICGDYDIGILFAYQNILIPKSILNFTCDGEC